MGKKIYASAVALLVFLLALVSCEFPGLGSTIEEKDGDGTVYSPNVSVSVVTAENNSLDYISEAKVELYQSLFAKGISVSSEDDGEMVEGSVIAVGETSRAASIYAYEKINNAAPAKGNICFSICYKGSTLAIAAVDAESLRAALEYFYTEYMSSDTLAVAVDLDYFVNLSPEEYEKLVNGVGDRESELAGWDNRWSALDGKLDEEAIEALKGLYALYGDSVYEWMANLWSCEIGGFYYSNSARDYDTFLPDLESTRQVLAVIRTSGMVNVYGKDNDKAFVSVFPEELRNKIVAFVKSCQSETDGYFYHKQWGENISSSRRGRDLDWAIELLALFGEKPNYPTALDRLSGATASAYKTTPLGQSAVKAAARVQAAASSGLPAHLQSEEAFIAYLDSFDFEANSHDTGHVVGSQLSQIKAAGLINVCCDYFDMKQKEIYDSQVANGEKPSGLWQREINYTSLSGLYKIGGIYSSAGRSMNYLDECVDSAIECIKSDEEPTVIIYVFNPWAGLQKAVAAMKLAVNKGDSRYDLTATYAKMRSECAALVNITVEKLRVFAKSTGGFSYNRHNSAPTTQGTSVSLGLAEGDVNATNIAVNSISGMVFSSMGMDRVPIWNSEDFDRWVSIIQSFDSDAEKKPIGHVSLDFEDCGEGEIPNGITAGPPSCIVSDGGNTVFNFYDAVGAGTRSYINTGINGSFDCAAFEMDVKFRSYSGNATTHQIKFRGSLGNMYMITFRISGNNLVIGDSTHTSGGIAGPLEITVPHGEWTSLRFEFYTDADRAVTESGFIVKIFVNGELAAESTNFFGPTSTNPTGHQPNIGFSQIEVYGMGAAGSELLVDNVKAELLPGQVYESEE